MEKIKVKKRMLWADITRITAIYLVVQIHTSSVFINPQFLNTFILKLSVISVPLFVMLSGALLLGKQDGYRRFFRKRCIKVLFPWIIWTFVYMYFNFNFRNHNQVISEFFSSQVSPFSQWIYFFFHTFLSNLWFLPLIFGLYILTPPLRLFVRLANRSDILYFIVFWFLIFSFLPVYYDSSLFPDYEPSIFFAPFQYVGYFLLGYILFKKKIFRNVKLYALFLFGILPILISLLPINNKYIQEFVHRFLDPGTVISSLFMFSFLFFMSNKIDRRIKFGLRKLISNISGASLGIYVIHEIVAFIFVNDIYRLFPLGHLVTFFIFVISACTVLLLQKIPLIRYAIP